MKSIEKLYDAFGELIYVIAMADGEIQQEELKAIEERLTNHPWGEAIQWSFNYEVNKNHSIEDLYDKVINYCEMHGPEPEYKFLMEVIEDVAKASSGINAEEQKVMDDFVHDLTEKFKRDIERINQG
ncbi:MAG: TerB family tellurite resistance protein [Bacteroidetes bacterium]|nr:MAG: TerB family tellurite resistance protein [Bacteroidota bacterium]